MNTDHISYIHFQLAYDVYKDHLPEIIKQPGILKESEFYSAVENPKQGSGDKMFYPELEDKAGILLYSLIMNHPFNDGNKRTAMLSTELFLIINGYALNVSVNEYVAFAKETAEGRHSKTEVIEWIKDKKVKLSGKTKGLQSWFLEFFNKR